MSYGTSNQASDELLTLLQKIGDTKSLRQVCSEFSERPGDLNEVGRCIVQDLQQLNCDGQDGITGPTYVDLETFWVMEQLIVLGVSDDWVLEAVQDHWSTASKFGLVGKINQIQPGLLEELPIAKRLRLLRFILKGCAGRPARLRGIANPVVCIPPSLQSEAEAQFASLQARIKGEWFPTSLFNPTKYQEDLSATLALVESELEYEQARDSS
jgi:hypothetical protein